MGRRFLRGARARARAVVAVTELAIAIVLTPLVISIVAGIWWLVYNAKKGGHG